MNKFNQDGKRFVSLIKKLFKMKSEKIRHTVRTCKGRREGRNQSLREEEKKRRRPRERDRLLI